MEGHDQTDARQAEIQKGEVNRGPTVCQRKPGALPMVGNHQVGSHSQEGMPCQKLDGSELALSAPTVVEVHVVRLASPRVKVAVVDALF